jgi:predicted RNA polymerase sigma factor
VTTARNRAIDRIRRDRTLAAKYRLLDVPQVMEDDVDETTIPDDLRAAGGDRRAPPRGAQDWPRLAALYGELALARTGSAVVELNQAAAIAEAGDVEAALELVARLELDPYHYLHGTRAELLRRLDRIDDARAAYERTRARALGSRATLLGAAAN